MQHSAICKMCQLAIVASEAALMRPFLKILASANGVWHYAAPDMVRMKEELGNGAAPVVSQLICIASDSPKMNGSVSKQSL